MSQSELTADEVDRIAALSIVVARANGQAWPSLWGQTNIFELAAFGVAMAMALEAEDDRPVRRAE